ncbi:hypothetical protein AVDCRST_MAG84-4247 [uncultured Microcoleus sp.]|uniref:Uncharacterized protein n=1 Tax=uncultured Microcoleus sp. TaxID=259945 RepID=A0A6J4MVN7_9CYAN|nr:hypothetical protein AVDCRST_MAG84-4247 [uncultured Microcoleus sp.]
MKYTPETGFLYSSRIITDSVARNPVSLHYIYAGKPVAEGRGGHPTRKFTPDVNSKVRSHF